MAKSTDTRKTPQALWEEQNKIWGFKLDAAANAENTKCEDWCGPDHPIAARRDGLRASWGPGPVWLNPPYSRGELTKWLAKALYESLNGVTTVALLPVDTSTIWFHAYVMPRLEAGDVEFLAGRLSFEGAPLGKNGKLNKAKTANMLVVFR
jgi:phage N-6-adenine-methyltransferase